MTPMGALKPNSIQLVADLINPETNQWDVETFWCLFFSPDADAILAMPRPRAAGTDIWAWAWEKSGIFTVRSAYRQTMQTKLQLTATVGSSSGDERVWRALWKLNVLPKIRVFWWRVLKDFLPSYGELQRTLHHAPEFPTDVCWEKVTIAN